jgi:hypothetical protein
VYFVWSGAVSRREPTDTVLPSIPTGLVRFSSVSKYELLTVTLRDGSVFGNNCSRIRHRSFYRAEEDETKVLGLPRSFFMSTLQPVILAHMSDRLKFFRYLPCFSG